jgi:hypothetical protein
MLGDIDSRNHSLTRGPEYRNGTTHLTEVHTPALGVETLQFLALSLAINYSGCTYQDNQRLVYIDDNFDRENEKCQGTMIVWSCVEDSNEVAT